MKQINNTKRYFVLTVILILSFHGYSQTNNQIDNKGLKQGFWLNYKNDIY